MIRVCHVVRQYAPCVGGLETFVANLARSLTAEGCASQVLTLDRCFTQPDLRLQARDCIDGVEVIRAPMIGHRRFFVPIIPREALSAYDVIHVHGIDGMFERVAREPPRRAQARIATSHGAFFHTSWMRTLKQVYFGSATRLAASAYDMLIGNSSADTALLRRLGREVHTIPNGVNALGGERARGRALLYIGRLSSHKHVDRLIDLLAAPALADAVLHIIGPDWDVTRSSLETHALSRRVQDRVRLHGHVSDARMAEIAADCGVFVSASTYEGFGMSLIEAMSIGLTPVVAPNDSFTELLAAAKIGRTADFSDPIGAAAIVAAERAAISESRRDAAIAFARRFSWQEHAAKTADLYRQVLARKLQRAEAA